ncbi:MAG: serine/threonine-protein kinase, partial [Planctomycetaceae bacterium]
MAQTKTCPKCAARLPADAPSGICPKCLMLAGLDSDQDSESEPAGVERTVITPPSSGFDPPELDALAPHFPQLELIALLGHGGMGAVYKARQPKLDRLVALKIIKPDTADDPTFAERFMREARTLARLSHSNIVAIHDFGEADVVLRVGRDAGSQPQPLYYFIMEYVDGTNLRQLLEPQELKPEQALAVVPQICEALQFAHDEGVVHRDIKPENILVDTKGRVKIADFGLARLVSSSPQDFTLTGTHQVMGTPQYMAPEQMAGSHGVDHRADIYSLGVVFYEMLTGEVPMGQFEPPSKKASVDGRLDEVVLRALAREPERRFQQASELKSSVELISSHFGDAMTAAATAPAPQRSAGISTIVEREVHNAWRWIAGKAGDSSQERPAVPVLLMIVLSIAGCLMVLLPWLTVEIDQVTTVSEVPIQLEQGVVRQFIGSAKWPGVAAAVAFGCFAFLMLVFPHTQWMTVKRAVLMTLIAAFALLHTFLFKHEVQISSQTVVVNEAATLGRLSNDEQRTFHDRLSGGSQTLFLTEINHRLEHGSGFFGSLGLSLSLLVLSAVGIRHAVAQRKLRTKHQDLSKQKADSAATAVQKALVHANAPAVVAILICIGGIGTAFVPWALDLNNAMEPSGMVHGYEDFCGVAASAVFFILMLTLFAGGTSDQFPRWRPWTILSLGVLALAFVSSFKLTTLALGDWRIEGGFLTSLGLCIALMLVGAWDLRHSLSRRSLGTSGDLGIEPAHQPPASLAAKNAEVIGNEHSA